jgi:nitroreductase
MDTGDDIPTPPPAAYPPPEIAAKYPFVELELPRLPEAEMIARGRAFLDEIGRRRSVRTFSDEPVPREVIDLAIAAAATAPSGAHRQPWTFVVIGDPATKHRIRVAVEEEERTNYEGGRIGPEWRDALERLGTTSDKSYLDRVPWIVVVFEQRYERLPDGTKRHNYYVKESVGIACGLFIAALHRMGVATLTHTPSPMAFLTRLLERPENERPFVLVPIGYPEPGSKVPDLDRKPLDEVMVDVPPRP